MQRTADFQNAIANACLPTAAGDVDDATTRDGGQCADWPPSI
jgi:hypothetical protein